MERDGFVKEKLQSLEEGCRHQGLPLTRQRRAIMASLAARTDHPSADQLYDDLKGRVSGLSRTTVYRVLEMLGRMGLVRRLSTPAPRAHFDADTSQHSHFFCTACDRLLDLPEGGPRAEEDLMSLPPGFTNDGVDVVVLGRCQLCGEKVV
jgi:Fur family peroxide stress response transcriptional regulator